MSANIDVSVTNVGAMLRLDRERFLFQLRDDIAGIIMPGRWGLFGGHCDPGEDFEVAIRRELLEELGFAAREVRLAAEIAYPSRGADGRAQWAHRQFFEVPITEADIAAMDLKEGAAMRVMTAKEYLALDNIIPWEAYGLVRLLAASAR